MNRGEVLFLLINAVKARKVIVFRYFVQYLTDLGKSYNNLA